MAGLGGEGCDIACLDEVAGLARELPGVRVEDRVAWDCHILWVADRWFGMYLPRLDGAPALTLKGDPDANAALVGGHDWIAPGWHMNKRHWITLRLDRADVGLVASLLEDAWEVTVAGLPRRVREPLVMARADRG